MLCWVQRAQTQSVWAHYFEGPKLKAMDFMGLLAAFIVLTVVLSVNILNQLYAVT